MKMQIKKRLKKGLIIGGIFVVVLLLCYVIIPKVIISKKEEILKTKVVNNPNFPDNETIKILNQLTLFESWPLHSESAHKIKEHCIIHYHSSLNTELKPLYEEAQDSILNTVKSAVSRYKSEELWYEAKMNTIAEANEVKLGAAYRINGTPWWDLVDPTKLPELCKWREFVEQYNIFIKNERYMPLRYELNFSFCEEM